MSLPAPTAQPVPYDYTVKGPARSRTYRWDTVAGSTSPLLRGEAGTLHVELRVSHYNKQLVARLGEVAVDGNTSVHSPMDDVTLARESLPRYSAKALDAYAAQILAQLPALLDATAKGRTLGALIGQTTPTAPGHEPVVGVIDPGHYLSSYGCTCGQMTKFFGYSKHDQQQSLYARHIADVTAPADESAEQGEQPLSTFQPDFAFA